VRRYDIVLKKLPAYCSVFLEAAFQANTQLSAVEQATNTHRIDWVTWKMVTRNR